MLAFCDLPDVERFRLRNAIEQHGGIVDGYDGDSVRVALPIAWREFIQSMEQIGLCQVPGSRHYFPLGSDNAPDRMRHDGSYPGSRGYWMYCRFNVPEFSLI